MAKPITEMDLDELLYAFQSRMEILIKQEASKWEPYQHPLLDEMENDLMPVVDHIVSYDPSPIYTEFGDGATSGSSYVKEAALLTLQERMRGF